MAVEPGPVAAFRFVDQAHLDEFLAEHVDRPCSDLGYYDVLVQVPFPTDSAAPPGSVAAYKRGTT